MGAEQNPARVKRLDSVPLDKVEYTPEGFLIDTPIVTSVGVFEYKNPDGSIRRELRMPEHVFNENSLATYEGKPVIITHSAGRVDKDNVTEEIVGTILSKGYPDGEADVRAKIVIHDIDTVKRSGMRELSLGYDLVLDETPGEWNGQPYDAIQTEIAINHLAVVREARAGEQARLNIDGKDQNEPKGVKEMAQEKKSTQPPKKVNAEIAAFEERRKRRLDEAEAAAQGADNADQESAVVEEIKETGDNPTGTGDKPSIEERVKLVTDRRGNRDAEGDPSDVDAAKGQIAQADADIATLLDIIEELQAAKDIAVIDKADSAPKAPAAEGDAPATPPAAEKPMNADSVDAAVAERLKLVRIGDRLNLDGLESLKPIEAKRRIVKAIKPDLRLDGKSDHYVNTAFDIALQELNSRKDTTYQRQQMFNADGRGAGQNKTKSQAARDKMLARVQNGGKE
jgi:hypothetical protein